MILLHLENSLRGKMLVKKQLWVRFVKIVESFYDII